MTATALDHLIRLARIGAAQTGEDMTQWAESLDAELTRLRGVEAQAKSIAYIADGYMAENPATAFESMSLTECLRSIVDGVRREQTADVYKKRADHFGTIMRHTLSLPIVAMYIGEPEP